MAIEDVREVQAGFDEAGRHFSLNDATEFQMVSSAGKAARFRTRTRQELLDWLSTLRAELTVAAEERDDPVHIIHTLLKPLLEESPLVDEDVHFVLFEHDHQDLDGPGRGGEDGDTTLGGRALPKGMPPIPTGAMNMADAGAALVFASKVAKMRQPMFAEELMRMHRQISGTQTVPSTDLQIWMKSLGIAKWAEYSGLLEQKDFSIVDVPYFTDESLRELGIAAIGPRNRMLASVNFMAGRQIERPAFDSEPVAAAETRQEAMQIQFFLPGCNTVCSLEMPLATTVLELKKILLYRTVKPPNLDMRQKDVRKAEGPLKIVVNDIEEEPPAPGSKAERRQNRECKCYSITLINRMDPFKVNSNLPEDEGVRLRQVPFIYYAYKHGIIPRLQLHQNTTSAIKQGLLRLTCGELDGMDIATAADGET
eukprot:COSAG05_NODE_3047_length_2386_cov_12.635010_2_plen_423_part_01